MFFFVQHKIAIKIGRWAYQVLEFKPKWEESWVFASKFAGLAKGEHVKHKQHCRKQRGNWKRRWGSRCLTITWIVPSSKFSCWLFEQALVNLFWNRCKRGWERLRETRHLWLIREDPCKADIFGLRSPSGVSVTKDCSCRRVHRSWHRDQNVGWHRDQNAGSKGQDGWANSHLFMVPIDCKIASWGKIDLDSKMSLFCEV